ncbi:MAG TPA: septum formation initiator family protein [Patescibacteria group bacterium]|jgi:cell division protein FtsB|nr:septum formation initiator family protein [Patescibacteria group bacterium]
MNLNSFLKTKTASVLLTLLLAAVLTGTVRLFIQKYTVAKEIAKLKQQANEINSKNSQLSGLIKYFNTDDYAERQARDKLNLKKEGEYVVSLPKNNGDGQVAGENEQNYSNPQKWYQYFFSK